MEPFVHHKLKKILLVILLALLTVSCTSISHVSSGALAIISASQDTAYALESTDIIETFSIVENQDNYSLNIRYPLIQQPYIDETIYAFIVSRIITFKQDLLAPAEISAGISHANIEGAYTLSYEIVNQSQNCLSVTFYERAVVAGNEVCNELYTFNFNRHTGDLISLDDIVNFNQDAIGTFFEAVQNKVEVQYPMLIDDFKVNVLPYLQNYSRYNYLSDGLLITFPSGRQSEQDNFIRVYLPFNEVDPSRILNHVAFDASFKPMAISTKSNVNTPPQANETAYFEPRIAQTLPDDKENISRGPRVAITFDDGPHKTYTNKILDVLATYKAKATFFVLGNRVLNYPDIIKRIATEGHSVGNHSFSHPQLTKLTDSGVAAEIEKTQNAIFEITGQRPKLVRVPFGRYSPSILDIIDLPLIQWSVDPEDWRQPNSQKIAQHVIDHVKDGSIILLHDIHGSTVDALPIILEALTQEGYEFVTVEELLGKDAIEQARVYYKK